MKPVETGGFVLEGAAEIAAAGMAAERAARTVTGTEQIFLGHISVILAQIADPVEDLLRRQRPDPSKKDESPEYVFNPPYEGIDTVATMLCILRSAAEDYPNEVMRGVLRTALSEYDSEVLRRYAIPDDTPEPQS